MQHWKIFFSFIIITLSLVPLKIKSEQHPHVCLTMIVRNEEKIIERCLNSAKPLIDCISICDTGSTDNTVQIIKEFMQKNNIPGQVHEHTWKNFSHNRTLSFDSACQTLHHYGFPLENTYMLLLDADMLLQITQDFKKSDLILDSYLLRQTTYYQTSYYNTRLIRASLPWKCVGVTHEYWSCQTDCQNGTLNTLKIDDRDDGGCKADKFERDVKLLTEALEQEPDNERYMYYLGVSLRALQRYEEAISWFTARIKKGGYFKEEIWYSKLLIGQCYADMKNWNLALASYLDAFQYLPTRAEPLQEISHYYRLKEDYHLAYFFAKQGMSIPYPVNDTLFVSDPVYDYLFDEDISIAAYYTGNTDEGFAASNRLILNKKVPYHTKERAYQNILFYLPKLQNAHYKPIVIDLPFIREGFPTRYNPMNPAIIKTENGYDVICRTVNYTQINAKHFKSLDLFDPYNTVKTKNFLVKYDKNWNLLSQQEIVENLARPKFQYRGVDGLEDCRLFTFKNSTWFTCTTSDTNPTGSPQISLCKLSNNRLGKEIEVEKLIPLLGPDPMRCEKNWLPFIKDNEFFTIYSYDPYIILKPKIDLEKNQMTHRVVWRKEESKLDFSRFSGSAAPIPFDDGYLMMVHETVYEDSRVYLHRFLYLDKDFNFKKLSKPFIFLHKGIEYCCEIAIDHSEKNLIMPIGIEDREAYLCTIDLNTVRVLLEPL